MDGVQRDGQGLVADLQRQVDTVNALFRDHWRRDGSRRRGPVRRLVYGTNPRSRYAKADELIMLCNALTELMLIVDGKAAITEPQRRQIQRIGQEIGSWPAFGGPTPDPTEHKRNIWDRLWTRKKSTDQGKERPGLEELWQIVCDVECLTIEVADGGWLRQRPEWQASLSPGDGGRGIDDPGRHGATMSPGIEVRHRDLDIFRHRLIDASRQRARAARQRRGNEEVRAERLLTAGVLAFPAAIFTAAFFSWGVYWPGGAGSGLGYMLVRSALALFAGALGGGLARIVRLRDAPLGTLEADRFRRAFVVQMMLGGAFGVVALVLVQLGALPKVGNGGVVEMIALYAFLAGWSEPFILGVLNRLGSGEGQPPRRGNDSAG